MSRDDKDGDVLDLIGRRDYRQAVDLLVRRHGDVVYAFCLRLLHDRARAEDVCQQAFLQAYKGLPGFGGGSSLRTWLLGIAKNRAIDALRAGRREAGRVAPDDELLDDAVESAPGPDERADESRASDALGACLERCVSPAEKLLILLHYRDGLSYEEMGALLGKKADTLRARVARALPKLRRGLE
ncbi:MAG TPA: RNA polymerase sigma factor [Polyangiaceae bacterium]|nr:RNA polymerase sigma factor [Polyangiaceae bacterium]